MGYELHITRREFWAENNSGPEISMAEWRALIDADPELRLDGFAEAKLSDGSVLRYESEGLAVWTGGVDPNGEGGWIDFREGESCVKNPDLKFRRKMWTIAQQLGAHVQGDDGELYGEDGEPIADPEDTNGEPKMPGGAKPWWKFW